MTSEKSNFRENVDKYLIVQLASLSAAPFWYPLFSRHLLVKSEILRSIKPGNLSHLGYKLTIPNLYRGFIPALMFQPLFPILSYIKNISVSTLKKYHLHNNFTDNLTTFGVGMTSVVLANPLDVIILKLQKLKLNQPNSASGMFIMNVIKDEGIKGLYKGSLPFALRNGTFFTGLTAIYPKLDSYFNTKVSNNPWVSGICSASLSALICNFFIVPLDLYSVMKQSPNYIKNNNSAIKTLQQVYHQHGVFGLFAGFKYRFFASTVEMYLYNNFIQFYSSKL